MFGGLGHRGWLRGLGRESSMLRHQGLRARERWKGVGSRRDERIGWERCVVGSRDDGG